MTTGGGNNAEAAIVIKAINEASDELNQIEQDTDDTSTSLFNFSRNAVTAGIAALGLSFGLKEALQAGDTAVEINAQTDALLRLLGPEVQAAFAELKPLFGEIADEVVALESEVQRAGLIITQNSGGLVPSVEQLKFAFDLAAATGVDLAQAAAAVGQAMQGNLVPLNELLDPSGRSFVSLDQAMEDLAGTSQNAASGMDRLTNVFGQMFEALGEGLDGPLTALARGFEVLAFSSIPGVFGAVGRSVLGLARFVSEIGSIGAALATSLWDGFREYFIDPIAKFFGETLPGIVTDAIPNLFDDITGGLGGLFGISNGDGGSGGSVQIVINGNVDSAERAAEFARQVARQMRETNRRGVNVSASGVIA